jgi:hypothetical protein
MRATTAGVLEGEESKAQILRLIQIRFVEPDLEETTSVHTVQ